MPSKKYSPILIALILLITASLCLPSFALTKPETLEPAKVPDQIEKTFASVVSISTEQRADWQLGGSFLMFVIINFFEGSDSKIRLTFKGQGTGVVLDNKGFILTNAHVIEDADAVLVTSSGGKKYRAEVIAKNRKQDAALLKIPPISELKPIEFGDSENLKAGEEVYALGNPFGYSKTVTRGIVSATRREIRQGNEVKYEDLIQTDAAINPGSSGGPLINAQGQVLGIVQMRHWGASGIGFAMPVHRLKPIIEELRSGEKERKKKEDFQRRFGFLPEEVRNPGSEAMVDIAEVKKGSHADKAGLKSGDRIVSIANYRVGNIEDVWNAGQHVAGGARCEIRILRGRQNFFTYLKIPT